MNIPTAGLFLSIETITAISGKWKFSNDFLDFDSTLHQPEAFIYKRVRCKPFYMSNPGQLFLKLCLPGPSWPYKRTLLGGGGGGAWCSVLQL